MNALAALDVLARAVHVLGVLLWMGHNYANVVQNPRFRPFDPGQSAAVDAALRREHGTFRYASLVALGTGAYMLWYRGLLGDALALAPHAAALGLGVWCAIAMVANLWLVLWPHQKKVLGFVPASDAERVRCSRITFVSSRTNTILSIPVLFLMVSGAHGPYLYG